MGNSDIGLPGVHRGNAEHQLGHRRSEIVDELVGHVRWYLFRGALVTPSSGEIWLRFY